jgi:hypothetical protein
MVLHNATAAKTLAMSGPTASKPSMFVMQWWPLHGECLEKTNTESTVSCCTFPLGGEKHHPSSYRGCSLAKGKHNEVPRDPQRGHSSLSSSHQSRPTQLHRVKIRNINHSHCRHMGKTCGPLCSSICHNRIFRNQVCQYRLLVRLTMKW